MNVVTRSARKRQNVKKRKREGKSSSQTSSKKRKDFYENRPFIIENREKYERFIYLLFLLLDHIDPLLDLISSREYDNFNYSYSSDEENAINNETIELFPENNGKSDSDVMREMYVQWHLMMMSIGVEIYLFPKRSKKSYKSLKLQNKYDEYPVSENNPVVPHRAPYVINQESRIEIEKISCSKETFVKNILLGICTPSHWDHEDRKLEYKRINDGIDKFILDYFYEIRYLFNGEHNANIKNQNIYFKFR